MVRLKSSSSRTTFQVDIIISFCPFSERQHTGHKPYSCRFCDYRTTDRNSLTKHTFKHTGEKRFFCRLCDFGTIQLVNLGYHYKTLHLQEALRNRYLFTCKLCKYFTIREDSFNAHMAKQHEEEECQIAKIPLF